jgi:hypothetical protein
LDKNLKTRLDENGYAVIRGLLNPATDLPPLRTGYSVLIMLNYPTPIAVSDRLRKD